MPEFIPGLQLSELYYQEAVRPIIERHFPALPYSAAMIGYGSDVMGFDTPVSRDHMWGPRLVLFLSEKDNETVKPVLFDHLRHELPLEFKGYSTHFGVPDAADGGVRQREEITQGPINPLIFIHTLSEFWQAEIGFDLTRPLELADWLTFSQQSLISVTSGKVFHDDLDLEGLRRQFAWYPDPVWYYLLAAQWSMIAEEEAFVGRTASVEDDLGSRLITARMVERMMRLCFLMEKRYFPYSKWFGAAFNLLNCSQALLPYLQGALAAESYPVREANLKQAYLLVLEQHNALGITAPLELRTRTYSAWHQLRAGVIDLPLEDDRNTRPYQVLFSGRIADAITEQIDDPQVRSWYDHLGSVSQFMTESCPALLNRSFRRSLKENFKRNR